MNYDWTSFTKRITINSSVEKIYTMWATTAGLEQWFLRMATYSNSDGNKRTANELIDVGDEFCWRWHGWPDSTQEKGTVLEANGKDFLKFSFGQEGAEGMICTIKIYSEENETICEMFQQNIPTDEKGMTHFHIGCMTGWLFYMTNLKSILEGGIDLRNKNGSIKNLINS
ncbi:MAG: SRPBCC domain-containing protein [Chitinophagaceae bacterium]|nr:MAG: SRPBCC domain-containing protein [Chitinophagaceae bacterium]